MTKSSIAHASSKPTKHPLQVFAIGEKVRDRIGLYGYQELITHWATNRNISRAIDPRHRLNPARCFTTPTTYNYQDKSGTSTPHMARLTRKSIGSGRVRYSITGGASRN